MAGGSLQLSRPAVIVKETVRPPKKKAPIAAAAVRLRGTGGEMVSLVTGAEGITLPKSGPNWSIQVGTFAMAAQARHQLNMLAGTQAEELKSALYRTIVRQGSSGLQKIQRPRDRVPRHLAQSITTNKLLSEADRLACR